MNIHCAHARLAFDLAAPLEFALTPLLDDALEGVVASAATQEIATYRKQKKHSLTYSMYILAQVKFAQIKPGTYCEL